MFLAGADGQTPELRAPSIKGAMRFWWRALNGHRDLKSLKEEEANFFGGTKKRSSFNLNAYLTNENPMPFNYKQNESKLPLGVKYFQYNFFAHTKALKRDGFNVDTQFKVEISSQDSKALVSAAKFFWIVSLFGGLGTRSRRGGGSFSIDSFNIKGTKKTRERLQFLNLNPLEDNLSFKIGIDGNDNLEWSHIGRDTKIYIIREGFKTWQEAMNDAAIRMMKIRDGETRKEFEGLQSYPFSQSDLNKKAAFGLPIQVRNERNDLVNLVFDNDQSSGNDDKGRRASPVYISVTKINDRYHWTVVFLSGKFMPEDSRIDFKKRSWPEPSMDLFNEFLQSLRESSEDSFFIDEKSTLKQVIIL